MEFGFVFMVASHSEVSIERSVLNYLGEMCWTEVVFPRKISDGSRDQENQNNRLRRNA